ncbi:hypothetical protein HDU79_001413 [Rhizoclosmatium sp. JEL0117]|nr:hypothetical protein HDU79_001406 [Rhizoclosmatium sp. JEL0117]KAJ3292458.1 hypothetical protein HDU79_001413 [Rhizoclosmatium sp. JEL0117]
MNTQKQETGATTKVKSEKNMNLATKTALTVAAAFQLFSSKSSSVNDVNQGSSCAGNLTIPLKRTLSISNNKASSVSLMTKDTMSQLIL